MVLPGNTADSGLTRQVKDDMRDWTLGKVIWVTIAGTPPQPTGAAGCCGSTSRRSIPNRTWTGKYLLHTNDPPLSTEDIAVGYKQLLQVERGWVRASGGPGAAAELPAHRGPCTWTPTQKTRADQAEHRPLMTAVSPPPRTFPQRQPPDPRPKPPTHLRNSGW